MRAEAKVSARILEFSLFNLHLKVPLAEQPRRRSAKPFRWVQLPHGTPTFAERSEGKVARRSSKSVGGLLPHSVELRLAG